VGGQALADRYAYVPALGLYVALAFGVRDGVAAFPSWRRPAAVAALASLLVLAPVSAQQLQHWRSSLNLFAHTLDVTRNNSVAHTHYGNALLAARRPQEAMEHYGRAEQLHPGLAWNDIGLGNALLQTGRPADARLVFGRALERMPGSRDALIGLGNAQLAAGDAGAAFASFRQAIEVDPASAEAWNNAGAALGSLGELGRAIGYFEQALARRPDYPDAARNLARARAGGSDPSSAASASPRKPISSTRIPEKPCRRSGTGAAVSSTRT
jgi:tetratricopeptide (TPR) repeat protein